MKKYGGILHNYRRIDYSEYKDYYPGTLGYMYFGYLDEDPTGRGFEGPNGVRTSMVVKDDGKQIETLNTIYDLA